MRSGSEPLEAVDLGEVVEEPLHVGRHGRGLGHVGAGGVEPCLVSVVLHLQQQRGRLELSTNLHESNSARRRLILNTRVFSLVEVSASTFTTKNLLRH